MSTSTTPTKDLRKPAKDAPNYRGFIQVVVGQGDKLRNFDVHEDLVTTRSKFFKKAMSGNWKEAKDRVVKLPEDDPAAFRHYVHLLYTNTLAVIPDEGEDIPTEEYNNLARLYVLAEKLQDIDTKNIILEAILLASREKRKHGNKVCPGLPVVRIVYAGTMSGSPMRRLLVDFFLYRGKGDWVKRRENIWPSDYLYDLAIALLDGRESPDDPTQSEDASRYMEAKDAAGS